LHEDVLFSLAMPNTRRHGTLAVADIAGEPKNSLVLSECCLSWVYDLFTRVLMNSKSVFYRMWSKCNNNIVKFLPVCYIVVHKIFMNKMLQKL